MLLQDALFVLVETHEVKVQVFYTIVIQDVVRFQQATKIEIVHLAACFGKCHIIINAAIPKLLADVEWFLVGTQWVPQSVDLLHEGALVIGVATCVIGVGVVTILILTELFWSLLHSFN